MKLNSKGRLSVHNLSKLVDRKKADTCHKILGCVAKLILNMRHSTARTQNNVRK